jgi:hypothetical protein
MVAGDHFDIDACFLARAYGRDGFLAWRIDHALQADKDQIRGHILMSQGCGFRRHKSLGESQHPQTSQSHILDVALNLCVVEGDHLPIRAQRGCAPFQDDLDGTFDIGLSL